MIAPQTAAQWCLRLAMVTSAISAVEPLVAWHFFDRRGPLWSKLSRLQELTSLRAARPIHELLVRDPVFITLSVAQLALSAAVFAQPDSRLGWALFAITTLVFVRLRVGLDASDGMLRMLLAANALRLISPDRLTTPFVLFVAAEACLSYFTSGFSKLGSTLWIEGRSLAKTLSTITYGDPWVSRVLWRFPILGRGASWSTLAVEVLFPLALVLPLPVAVALMIAAGLFHLCCARIMALGSFFWVFTASYPCVLAARAYLPWGRSGRPLLAGVLLFYAVAVGGQLVATVDEYRRLERQKATSSSSSGSRG